MRNKLNYKSFRAHGPSVYAIYPGSNFWLSQAGILTIHTSHFLSWAFASTCLEFSPYYSDFQLTVGCASLAIMICITHLNHKLAYILIIFYKYRSVSSVLPWFPNVRLYRSIQNDKKDNVAFTIKLNILYLKDLLHFVLSWLLYSLC